MEYTITRDEFIVSTDKNMSNVHYVHAFLAQSYWSPGIAIEKVSKAIEGSLCFELYNKPQQIGFARMVTDRSSFAYLADVFVDETVRGKGLGKWLIESTLAHPDLQGLRRIMLATKDAHTLYEQFGFTAIPNPERYMVYNPTVNKIK